MEGYLICFLLGIITGIVMTLSITHSPRQAEPVVVYESARREESPGCSVAIIIGLLIFGVLLVLSQLG